MEIDLTRGLVAIIDDEDYPLVNQHKWHAKPALRRKDKFYAATIVRDLETGKQRTIRMHQLIFPGAPEVDHRDDDGLNNRRSNLRPCGQSQNQGNARPRTDGKIKYRGVSPMPNGNFQARIGYKGKVTHLGVFATPEEAAGAWNTAAVLRFGEFARLNVIPSPH
ncbi:HNH endonuclease [Zavarzinella formosa]|uniref:HNH endonuclease n=1 Tax=Zavarzinella formosa TaxID=360055 RepID=UPI0002EC3CA4|nr:HNH endonuclease [Zavarzinella formosa]